MAARLWWVRPETLQAKPAALAMLDEAERGQHQRYIPQAKRHEYLVTRVLVRTVLGEILGCPPERLRFVPNAWGRPELAPDVSSTPVYFNVSHTDGLVVCLVSTTHQVGVDTEQLARAPTLLKLAPRVFSVREQNDLAALAGASQARRAVDLWTLKESYIKARGMGLALPLAKFSCCFDKNGVQLEFCEDFPDDGRQWQLQTHTFSEHVVSTVLELTSDPCHFTVANELPVLLSDLMAVSNVQKQTLSNEFST